MWWCSTARSTTTANCVPNCPARGNLRDRRATPRCWRRRTTTGARTGCDRLRGMFAFVIWDRSQRPAFGARDRFGIKPFNLCYTPTGAVLRQRAESVAAVPPSPRCWTSRVVALPDLPVRARAARPARRGPPATGRRALALHAAEGLRTHRYFRPHVRARVTAAGRRQPRPHPGSPDRQRDRAHAAPTYRSARSCPAASTRPRWSRWLASDQPGSA